MDFKELSNILFTQKSQYLQLSELEKEKNFFIINRKIGVKYLAKAQSFNRKGIDTPSALDIWATIFDKVTTVPGWWFLSSKNKKDKVKKKTLTEDEVQLLHTYENHLQPDELKFLQTYYPTDITNLLKELKKYE